MKTFVCQCDATLFRENSRCVACDAEVAHCPGCDEVVTLIDEGQRRYRCGNPGCSAALMKCQNNSQYQVCNSCVLIEDDGSAPAFCRFCGLNRVVPDVAVEGNLGRWHRIEAAKRRLLYTLDLLRLPYGEDIAEPPLSFVFMADEYRTDADGNRVHRPVYTGHANGEITINLREADSVERERTRVELQEPHRTLIGHFRHEIGHYYWEVLVKDRCEDEFANVFGDHRTITYNDAKDAYYQSGPAQDWQSRFISAYASMHPFEDFAETFGAYLDMVSLLDTAQHAGLCEAHDGSVDDMLLKYSALGIKANELNRDMGLLDLVPEVFVPPVVEKLRFVHELGRRFAPVVELCDTRT